MPTKEMVRDVLDIAARSPWGWPQWNAGDPEGEDVRAASIGQLSVVYVINRLTWRLSVLDVVWIGLPPVSTSRPLLAMLWAVGLMEQGLNPDRRLPARRTWTEHR
ncbi:hypothetical protein OG440_00665 [Streptomyces sp. NBC_00637]|uniref:hypothetical protein n=1 Tax=Streptomyces sp. NBC_00637 TaxID=2903667 RepID=UPI00324A2B31